MSDPTLPKPTGKVVNFDQIKTLDQASDYALGGYHAALGKAGATGPVARLWKDAGDAYAAAYGTILAARALPPADGLKQATSSLHEANHLSDVAAAGAVS